MAISQTQVFPAARGGVPRWLAAALAFGVATTWVLLGTSAAVAASVQPTVNLGTAAPFAVLAGSGVSNTGNTTISGDLGVAPSKAVTGFPPGSISNGGEHVDDAVAIQAESDLTTAYTNAQGRTPFSTLPADLGGDMLYPGVYHSASGIGLTGTVILNGQGNPNSVFIFQAGSTLITASNSTVSLTNGAQACNVFWQVTSSATLGSDTTFVGTIMALTSASLVTGASVNGRVLARNGAVTLEDNNITVPSCTTTVSASPSPTTGGGTAVPDTGAAGSLPLGDGLVAAAAGLALVGFGLAVGLIRRTRLSAGDPR